MGIHPLIDLRPIERNFKERGWSNPKKILDKLVKDIDESLSGQISYESAIERIIEYLLSEKCLEECGNKVEIAKGKARLEYENKLDKKVDDLKEVGEFFVNMLSEEAKVEVSMDEIIKRI